MGGPLPDSPGAVTVVLGRLRAGEREAFDQLFPLVYGELRDLARLFLRREREGHTLQPTALTHEAYLRLLGDQSLAWQDRSHFLAVAARAMRRVLVEHARARRRRKRGGPAEPVPLDTAILRSVAGPAGDDPVDLIALDRALSRLEKADARKVRVVEFLYFGGLTAQEAAEVLGVTGRTVERDWRFARLWLLRELEQGAAP